MRFRCVSLRRESDVLPRLQDDRYRPAAGMGHHLSDRALRLDVLLQLLVGLVGANDRAFLESTELSRIAAQNGLLGSAAPVHLDRGAGRACPPGPRIPLS